MRQLTVAVTISTAEDLKKILSLLGDLSFDEHSVSVGYDTESDAPPAKRRGRPPKVVKEEEEEEDDGLDELSETPPRRGRKKTKAKKVESLLDNDDDDDDADDTPSEDDVKTAVRKAIEAHGAPAVKAVFAKFKVTKFPQLKPQHYAALLEALSDL